MHIFHWKMSPLSEHPFNLTAVHDNNKSLQSNIILCLFTMAPPTLSHQDYTVAWICALPLELTAAKAMLDEIHSDLCQPPSDHNAYTLGRLHGHNVVIACLPSGVYGTTSAATILAQMLPTFPSLIFGLMVGIGGGVPTKANDIRLGDVVVSKPTTKGTGVIQYDYGKTLSNGRIQNTGSLNKPPMVLLTAISQIQSDYIAGSGQMEQILFDTFEKNMQLKAQFSRPYNDWLFHGTYNHQSSASASECSLCDPRQLVSREPRASDEPYIHYGLIASGNQVMKDALSRDLIAQELDILCFEMEAAGLMDQLPCLVIRGICDYCDSHKHKQWQGYASFTAAAFAKLLLSIVSVTLPQIQADHRKPSPLDQGNAKRLWYANSKIGSNIMHKPTFVHNGNNKFSTVMYGGSHKFF
jgi:nucleoside phosphorylase